MNYSPLLIADPARADQFRLIGSVRNPFRDARNWIDANGIAWRGCLVGGHWFGVTWLGSSWVFDPIGQDRRQEELVRRRSAMAAAGHDDHDRELRAAAGHICWGPHVGRLLWGLYAFVLKSGKSVIRIPDINLASFLWGTRADRPRHWRTTLKNVSVGLTWLHIAKAGDDNMVPPVFDASTALVTHIGDLKGNPSDEVCDDDCPEKDGLRHHHFLFNIGRGLLGSLERMVASDKDGYRTYDFNHTNKRKGGPSLRGLGRASRITSIYLPAQLGLPSRCDRLTHAQRRIIQTLIRETTRKTKVSKDDASQPEAVINSLVPGFARLQKIDCPLLDAGSQYVAFNGNKRRKGQGHKLSTWASRCGYSHEESAEFLRDLACVAAPLTMTVVGIGRGNTWFTLDQLVAATNEPRFLDFAERVHLRMYAPLDYVERWNDFFGWSDSADRGLATTNDGVGLIRSALHRCRMSQRQLAESLGVAPSFLSMVLGGKKSAPQSLLHRTGELLRSTNAAVIAAGDDPTTLIQRQASTLEIALAYRRHVGWSVIPQIRGRKNPPVKWKSFQTVHPTEEDIEHWWRSWPDAGIALILGSLSNVFVIDVDGQEAHDAMIQHLGAEPSAPKALSGNGSPFRYHLFFRYPSMPTKARATPWHPKLEFRGEAALVILPPSIHKSGNAYTWLRPIDEHGLPPLPEAIVDALRPTQIGRTRGPVASPVSISVEVSASTEAFLRGKYASGPNWNERLFRAACDLRARNVPFDDAEPVLLAGAQPWNSVEEATARRTIESAYSDERSPSRY